MDKLIPTVRRPYVPFYSEIMEQGEADSEEWKKFFGEKYSVTPIMQLKGVWFYPKYHMEEFQKRLVGRLVQDKELFLKMREDSIRREEEVKKAVFLGYTEYRKALQDYMVTLATYFVCDEEIESKVIGLLETGLGKEKTQELMNYLTMPLEDNYAVKEKLSLLTTNDFEEHLKMFSWLHSRYGFIREYNLEAANRLLQELKKENYLEKYEQGKEKIREAIKIAKEALGEKEHMIDVMQFFIYYRTQRTDVINMTIYQFAPRLTEIAKEKGLEYEEILFCSKTEIDENKIPSKEEIKERRKACAMINDENGFRVIIGSENEKLIEQYFSLNKQKDLLEGRAAYKGKVSGRAKIIIHLEDMINVKEGDILVTNMTTSNMTPAMHKAAAFVTDEGGITCHACIVAREMRKPCIIGTKNATKTFRDGELIEVDADKGIVRKIRDDK